jgi:lysophosphatidylcholine acyltransferase / lyso-PAF acetyltransferase
MTDIIKLTDPVFVERSSQSSRNNVVTDVLDKIKHHRMVFFPEGTCSNRRALCQFKVGAFKPGIPIQPILVKYNQYGGPDTLSWTWDGPPALQSIYLTLCRFSTGLKLVKLPVYYPSPEEQDDPELYANNVSELMAKQLKIPCLSYSFDDSRYLTHRYVI